ncbi:hypothetical protein C8R45DRAFT_1077020 [Mycena sanguinolenta]|nr:hypothetical protein C8R45DRAFT_1077020 [Mycena sanguinolenta]
MNDAHRNFDRATNWHDSTALPNPTNTTAFYPPFHGGLPADTAPWEPDQFVQTWSPNAVGTTAGPAKQARGREARPKSPCVASVDGVDAVSAAFLQLVELHERSQIDKLCSDLLRLSLKNGYLAPDELLAVVDWERLRNLAEKSLGRAFTSLVSASRIDHPDGGAAHPSGEHERSLSNTTYAGHPPAVSSRRCSNCGEDHTTQWRRHPATSEYLCNRCGHHQRKYGRARSLQVTSRGTQRARANHKSTRAMPTPPK